MDPAPPPARVLVLAGPSGAGKSRLARRLTARRLVLTVTDAAREWLTLTGFDPVYGARPLRRLMQREIDDRLARALLAGEVHDGDVVRVDVAENGEGLTVAAE